MSALKQLNRTRAKLHLIYHHVIIKAKTMNINQIGTIVAKERKVVNAPAQG